MESQWTTNREKVQQAMTIARETKILACAIKTHDNGRFAAWGERYSAYSDVLIASFEYFLSGDVRDCYVFAAWINMPQGHMKEIKDTMRLFGVDVEALRQPEPAQVSKPKQEAAQLILF